MSSNVTTLRTIADEVGVDVSTVSKVLRKDKSCYISASKKQRIIDTATKLSYVPNLSARRLATGKCFNIGFIISRPHNLEFITPLITEFLEGIYEKLREEDFRISIIPITYEDNVELKSVCYMRSVYDGLIFALGMLNREGADIVMASGMPAVIIDTDYPGIEHIPKVLTDTQDGIDKSLDYLRKKGYRKIAYYGAESSEHENQVTHQALFEQYFSNRNLPFDSSLVYKFKDRHTHRTTLSAFLSADGLTDNISRIDAVVCGNDFIAIGLCERLQKSGIQAGRDIGVVGFDNVEEELVEKEEERFLTTVKKSRKKIGSRAASIILNIIKGENVRVKKHESFPCELIIRKSA